MNIRKTTDCDADAVPGANESGWRDHADVDWSPVSLRGANFDQHRLSLSSPDMARLIPTFAAVSTYAGFTLLGLFLVAWVLGQSGFPPSGKAWSGIAASLLFTVVGLYLLFRDARPVWFDRATNRRGIGFSRTAGRQSLNEIVALQLLEKKINTGNRNRFPNYELNLLLVENRRLTIANYYSVEHALSQSGTLAEFLAKALLLSPGLTSCTNEIE